MVEHGGRIELPDEGGLRVVYVVAADPAVLEGVGRTEYAIRLAEWLAFELSIWHEIATWFGWSALSGFPELASAFSPEDLYSNLLGTRLAGQALRGIATAAIDLPNSTATIENFNGIGTYNLYHSRYLSLKSLAIFP